jgi:gliding motility-associated-like protein
MNAIFNMKYLFSCIISLFIINFAFGQFTINAGANQTICPGDSAHLGGTPTATGGKAPYKFLWTCSISSSGLSSSLISNPSAMPSDFAIYTLRVTDDTGAVKTKTVSVSFYYTQYVNAGINTSFCLYSSDVIGGTGNILGQGVDYTWSPSVGLNDSTLPRPTAKPAITTIYTLTANFLGCPPKIDTMIVTVIQPPPINAGDDITIKEGVTYTLHAKGGFNYDWTPAELLMYPTTANPDAEPRVATTYYLYGTDAQKRCHASDTVTIFVEPCNDVVIYNTFTPNNDGNNDIWYISNIYKYPKNNLEIYNRNGKLVYKATGYLNTWDGKSYLGEELPSATYFYMLDLGDGAGNFHGTVSIVK